MIGLVILSTLASINLPSLYVLLRPSQGLVFPWTFLTTTLGEDNIFTFGISGVTIYYGGKYLERAWSSLEFVKFLLVVTLIPNILCVANLVTLFAITGDESWM